MIHNDDGVLNAKDLQDSQRTSKENCSPCQAAMFCNLLISFKFKST